MSFRDLDGRGGHGSKLQPKQRRDDGPFEKSIKSRIQELQDSIRAASGYLERAGRSPLSVKAEEGLDKALGRSRELVQDVEDSFRDWTVHLSGEPAERHRKRFATEKLQKAFEEEVAHLKEIGRRALLTKQETLAARSREELRPLDEGSDSANEEHELLEGLACEQMDDMSIQNRIARERSEGIQRIRSQVSEVNQIFRDLASVVTEQGQHLDTIEDTAQRATEDTSKAVKELKKTSERQRGSRERTWIIIMAALLLCAFSLWPHLHAVRPEAHEMPAPQDLEGLAPHDSGNLRVIHKRGQSLS